MNKSRSFTTPSNLGDENMLKTLVRAARAGGQLIRQIVNQSCIPSDRAKEHEWDRVTRADTDSQEEILKVLRAEFPDIPIIAEEGNELQEISTPNFFVVDPLDGTTVFTHGGNDWGVTIAYIENYRPKVGVIFLPARGILVEAERGQGVFIQDTRVFMPKGRPLAQTLVATELGPWINKELHEQVIFPLMTNCAGLICTRSAVASAVKLLNGEVGAYLNVSVEGKGTKIWDLAAAALAVEEAGGVIVGDGKPFEWKQIPVQLLLANGGLVAQQIMDLIRK